MTNANCIHQFRHIIVKDMLTRVQLCCASLSPLAIKSSQSLALKVKSLLTSLTTDAARTTKVHENVFADKLAPDSRGGAPGLCSPSSYGCELVIDFRLSQRLQLALHVQLDRVYITHFQ